MTNSQSPQARPAYLSASRLTCYSYCPAEFYKRYVLKKDEPPTPERLFGTAVHKGFEAHFKGEDDDLAFLSAWRTAQVELAAAGQVLVSAGSDLKMRGLELLEMVRELDLQGEPERRVGVIHPDISLPFIGYVDLWDEALNTIYDFKTTGYGWTQDKADAQVFQPAIYSQAYSDQFMVIPQFTFVVLPRIPGPVQVFDGTRTGDQILAAFEQARVIHGQIENQEFDCTCGKHEEAA